MKVIIWAQTLALLALSVAVAFNFHKINNTRVDARQQTCQRFVSLDNQLVKLVKSGEKEAGTLQYYKEHPSELTRVIKADQHAISVLTPPRYC